MNAANLNRKNRDATGIGACACARHGCFVPHTVVDFQKGERYASVIKWSAGLKYKTHSRQMNIDYAICNALKYQSFGLPQGLVIYDIGCQWIVNFQKHLKQSHYLSIPQVMELLVAVGNFTLVLTFKSALFFILSTLYMDQVNLMARFWKHYGHLSTSFQLLQQQ